MANGKDLLAILRWELDRAETALSALEDIGWGKSDAACEIDDFADELRDQIAKKEATDDR